jgi:hypothetical protein
MHFQHPNIPQPVTSRFLASLSYDRFPDELALAGTTYLGRKPSLARLICTHPQSDTLAG